MPSFDFVKDYCVVGSAVLGKRGYNLSSTQSMVLFHIKPTEKSFLIFDGVRNVAGCIAEKEFRIIVFLIFDASC